MLLFCWLPAGFCFELNGLLGWLLTDLGYDVTCLMARVNRGHWQEQVEPNWGDLCHILLGVRLPSASQQLTYLCDVGFGAPHGEFVGCL